MAPNIVQNILVISRDEEMLNVWTTFFREKNFYVISESDARYGLQTARLLSPALIILDLDVPKNQRIEICRTLRSTTTGVLILLAPRDGDISEYYQAGVDELLATPTNPMAVLIKSITWLSRQEWIVARKETQQIHP